MGDRRRSKKKGLKVGDWPWLSLMVAVGGLPSRLKPDAAAALHWLSHVNLK